MVTTWATCLVVQFTQAEVSVLDLEHGGLSGSEPSEIYCFCLWNSRGSRAAEPEKALASLGGPHNE